MNYVTLFVSICALSSKHVNIWLQDWMESSMESQILRSFHSISDVLLLNVLRFLPWHNQKWSANVGTVGTSLAVNVSPLETPSITFCQSIVVVVFAVEFAPSRPVCFSCFPPCLALCRNCVCLSKNILFALFLVGHVSFVEPPMLSTVSVCAELMILTPKCCVPM